MAEIYISISDSLRVTLTEQTALDLVSEFEEHFCLLEKDFDSVFLIGSKPGQEMLRDKK